VELKHKPVKVREFYKTSGKKVERTKRVCDRCGDGTFMAEHKDRWYCGKCGMTIWKKSDKAGDEAEIKKSKPNKTKS